MLRDVVLLVVGFAATGMAQYAPNRYALFLEDPPVSARFTTREEMRTTAGVAYRQQIESAQEAVKRDLESRNIQVAGSVSTLLNAVFVVAGPERLAELRTIPGVAGVQPLRRGKKLANRATQLVDAPGAWSALGGQQNAGAGIKIAIIDTGIDQTHPAFQDPTLSMPAGFPLCTAGHPEDCAYTNNKVIVARSYVRMLAEGTGPADSTPDDFSPRDRDGHGSNVAALAAANQNTGTVSFTGMAPQAYLGNYKVYGSPLVNDYASEDVFIAAVEDALKDGMDVANFSNGVSALTGALDTGAACGLASGVPCDPLATAFEAAVQAGMVIAAAAGNSGTSDLMYPAFNSIVSPATAPSVIAVGATINSHVLQPGVSVVGANAPASLVGIPAQLGDSLFFPSIFGTNQAPLVDVTQLGDTGFACAALPPFSLNGSFALIENNPAAPPCDFYIAALNAQEAGATGVVFYMATSEPPVNPEFLDFLGPVVMISNQAGVALKSYIDSNPGQVVAIDKAGSEQDLTAFSQLWNFSPALMPNQLASYSSVGPAPDGSIKPDLVATGGFDAAEYPDLNDVYLPAPNGMYSVGQRYDPNGEVYTTNGYIAADGTSNSAPLTAGAAALVKQAHPNFTPTQIKSALVNGAAQSVITDDFGDPVDVQSIGAGLLDAGAGVKATVTAEPSSISFGFLTTAGLPTPKTLTVTNKGTSSVTLAAAVLQNSPVAGTNVTATLSATTLLAGAKATLTVALTGIIPAAGEYSGFVTLQGSGVSLQIPYMYVVGTGAVPTGAVPNAAVLGGGGIGAPGTDMGPVIIQVTDLYGIPIPNASIPFTVNPSGSATLETVSGHPACSPFNSTSTVTCPTDNYGNAYAEVILGSTPSALPVISAGVSGTQIPVNYEIMASPAITAAGVVDAAVYRQPIAPGSYINIYGQNLVDSAYLNNPNGDPATSLDSPSSGALPLTLDFTTVTFDVPSAGISVPGYVYFVSPGVVSVWVPRELQGQTSAQVKVTVDETVFGNVVTVPLSDYAPQLFQNPPGVATAFDQNGNLITSSNPVARGAVAVFYANGLGPVNNPPASGDPAVSSTTTSQPVVRIGTQNAQVLFSGLAPGSAGEYQINVMVPTGISAGIQTVILEIGGQTSQPVTITVN
jgi:minor extracellular serine protease Vpr